MRYYLTCIFLFGLYSAAISNRPVSENKSADSLYYSGEYFRAAIAYERLFYYAHSIPEKNNALFQKALCYKALGEFEESYKALRRINYFGVKDSARNIYNYESALMAYLSEKYALCNRHLILLQNGNPSAVLQKGSYLLGALNSIMLQDFEISEANAKQYLSLSNYSSDASYTALESLYSRKNLPKIRSEKALFWIGIIPGFGQIYAGKPLEGITNAALNLAALSFGVYQVLNTYYFTGYFVGALSINKLYFGGRARAKNLLKDRNHNVLIEYHDEVKDFLLNPLLVQ